jgi:ribose transport system ATP-binding protein
MPRGSTRLEIRELNKTFGSAQVLTNVELTVLAGEIHGLAGQNGSGKSTLIKILTGLYTPDPGARYWVDGAAIRLPVRWHQVHAAGVSVVHQDLGLLDQLNVAENICVGGFPTTRMGRIDAAQRDRLAERTLLRLGVELDPRRLVATLTAAERAEVAIARAMRDYLPGAGLIILDESTRALAGQDLARIHLLLRRLCAGGSAVLMISHNLTELMDVTDRVTILRDGRLAGAGLPTSQLSEREIAHRMLGSTVDAVAARSGDHAKAVDPLATISGLSGARVSEVGFALGRGEILGITGLPGSGYEEIPYLVTGAQQAASGSIKVEGTVIELGRASVAACIRAGIVLVPERRDRDGLAFEQTVGDNISLPSLRPRGRPWFVARHWQREVAENAVDSLGIRPPTPSSLVKQLSGGNQQKVLLAKWLAVGPRVLVLHEPTQGVDVGARRDILIALQRAADSGVGVILVSSEPDDLAAACDRVLIYDSGGGLRQVQSSAPHELIKQLYSGSTKARSVS